MNEEVKYWLRLYPNNKTKDTQPDYFGEMKMEGNAYSVVGWHTKDKNGKSCINCKVKLESGSITKDSGIDKELLQQALDDIVRRLNILEGR
jgi:hypothetical protein